MKASLVVVSVIVCGIIGCETGECIDSDRDGYGPNCELGEDCDPNNALRNADCRFPPPPDCAATPGATGCPCLPGSNAPCFSELSGIGQCLAGRARCVSDFWGICEGGVRPSGEQCNNIDDDCDGSVDEGVISACGGCTPGCLGGLWGGGGPVPFEVGPGLATTRFDELTLSSTEVVYGTLWVPNTGEGTLSRIDVDSAIETARYATGGTEPSRVAVDFLGDAWVINREFDGTSTYAKVAGTMDRCVDRDGDGVETSTGPADVLPFGDDECVLLTGSIGGPLAVARAIAIDGDTGLDGVSGGDAWIGLHDAEAIVELDGFTGAELRRVETPGFAPYAATFDRWGTLWMISRDGLLARIDPRRSAPEPVILEAPLSCFLLYGLAADPDGRLLMTGFSCDRIISYDPDFDRWIDADAPLSPRAATPGPDGRIFIAHTAAMVSEILVQPLRALETHSLQDSMLSPVETIGVAVDSREQVWAISSRGGTDDLGVATRVDPTDGAVTAQLTLGRAPHVQGDLTGARVRARLAESGTTTVIFDGCGPDEATVWVRAHIAAEVGSAGTVELEIRHAVSRARLSSATFALVGAIPDDSTPWPLDLPDGGVIELRLTLRVDGVLGAPRVERVGIEWQCEGPD